jgi:hypothetical protein
VLKADIPSPNLAARFGSLPKVMKIDSSVSLAIEKPYVKLSIKGRAKQYGAHSMSGFLRVRPFDHSRNGLCLISHDLDARGQYIYLHSSRPHLFDIDACP